MSETRRQDMGNRHTAGRVTDKIRHQFPGWAAANEAGDNTASTKSELTEFRIVSNWILLPGGLQEFFDELKKAEARSPPQLRPGDSVTDDQPSNKIISSAHWRASEQHKKECVMALAPGEIQLFTFRTAWIMPEDLVKRDVGAAKLVPSETLAELQLLTNCQMMTGNDGLVIYIGAISETDIAVAERKLNTLAKYAGIPAKAEKPCQSFLYAENELDILATFTYAARGSNARLRTFFLDRAKYQLASTYGKIIEQGVFVTLMNSRSALPTIVPVVISPAISAQLRNNCYIAFSPSWNYRPKPDTCDPDAADKDPSGSASRFNSSADVTAWVTRLPRPELMLPHGDRTETPDLDSSPTNELNRMSTSDSKLANTAREQTSKRQSNSHPSLNEQTPSKPTRSTWEELQKADLQPAQEGLYEEQPQTFPQRGNASKKRGGGKRNNLYEPQRAQGRGNPRPRGRQPRGGRGRGRANGKSYRGRGGQTATHIPQDDFDDPEPRRSSYVPPHQRHRHAGDLAGADTESSSDSPKVSETNPTELGVNEPGSQQRLDHLRASIKGVAKEIKALQPQPQGLQSTQNRPRPPVPFNNVSNRPLVQRSTMIQQASSTSTYLHAEDTDLTSCDEAVDLTSDRPFLQAMNQALVQMLSSLEIFRGRVTLKAELGRLCLTKINREHVHIGERDVRGPVKSLQDMKQLLDEQHVSPRDVIFTNILTAEGADANYIAHLPESSRMRTWLPHTRRTVYEIAFCAMTEQNKPYRFVVEVDGGDFTYQIREFQKNSSCLFVHCPKRAWDFQVTLSKGPNLGSIYGHFARDLVDSMRVMPQEQGPPLLEFTVKKAYQVEMLLVRTKNIASYKSHARSEDKDSPSNTLEICEVHDMKPSRNIISTQENLTVPYKPHAGNVQLGQLSTWYEASIQSELVNKALRQNQDLELGEEVGWTPEQLRDAGAFEELLRSAINMVKKIDGVGYWGNNYQGAMVQGMPPSNNSTTASQYSAAHSTKKDPW
ncbi:hypothetical protein F5Y05DRAFT_419237 [Hypoxylon sp. FL0543]|nr:hypothetical protein F5Y05DRAFT_419237 [Hypoxylon sp. FL0543]